MRVIALSTLKSFWKDKPEFSDVINQAMAWYQITRLADWDSPAALKRNFRTASILKHGRVVFNLAGNKYQLVVQINYPHRIVYIRFIGTHRMYDRVDAQTV